MTHSVSHAKLAVITVIFKLADVRQVLKQNYPIKHSVALLFLAALGLTGLMAERGGSCPEGKMTFFSGEISHKKVQRASNSHLTNIATWFPIPWLISYSRLIRLFVVVTLVMSRTNPLMWDTTLWILKHSLPRLGVNNTQLMSVCLYWWPENTNQSLP